ncbi:MAG: NUDIX domain-containing protein [Bacteroidota bacterium]
MYKVFVNGSPLILTNERPKGSKAKVFKLEDEAIENAIAALAKRQLDTAYIYHKGNHLLEAFTSKIPMVLAAGGIVKNKKGKVLFIYRNGKWDLPKGKLDKGESIEAAAIREVEEETGVRNLSVGKFIQTTYHIFKRGGVYRLKKVFWFEMSTDYSGRLKGQKEEGITKVKWKGPRKTKKALRNSYKNISVLFEENSVF